MPDRENESIQDIANQEQDVTNTIQAYISKLPLLNDGANTGGTYTFVSGTGYGTWGTYVLTGTWNYTPQKNYAYVLKTLSFNVVNPAADAGTIGTMAITGVRINGVNLGTTGGVTFSTVYGDALTLYGSLSYGYTLGIGGTGADFVGTFSINNEVVGWRFRTVDE